METSRFKGEIVFMTDEEILKCKDYAERCWMDYDPRGRSPEKIKKVLFESKLSELAAAKMFSSWNDVIGPSFEKTGKSDGGWDLIIRDMKVNVKEYLEEEISFKSKVLMHYNYDLSGGCYWYMLMMLKESNYHEVKYIGKIRLKDINPKNLGREEKYRSDYLLRQDFENSKS